MATNSTRLLSNFDKNIAATNAANTVPDYERGAAEWTAGLAKMDAGNEEEDKAKKRRGIAAGLKDLSKRGYLTSELLKEARGGATEAGITDDQFSSFVKKNRIKPSNFATAAPTSSPEEAAQNVMFQNEFGPNLGSLAAMNEENSDYELGSGSPLSQPARAIGPESGKYRRSARRLRRQGYGGAAQEMAMRGEDKRMNESAIDTPAARMQRMVGKIQVSREANKQDKLLKKDRLGGQKGLGWASAGVSEKKPDAKKQLLKKDRLKMWA
jgi:hypothetical protein|tara:strand:+ start:1588 stop:2391 length:804 start_codon:yes stop_codon:yes gene_type:complete